MATVGPIDGAVCLIDDAARAIDGAVYLIDHATRAIDGAVYLIDDATRAIDGVPRTGRPGRWLPRKEESRPALRAPLPRYLPQLNLHPDSSHHPNSSHRRLQPSCRRSSSLRGPAWLPAAPETGTPVGGSV